MVSKARSQALDCDSITIHLLSKMCCCPKVNQVKRNLFGPSRGGVENRLCDKRLTDMAEKASQEWNFDFVNETPQAGRYVWERVQREDVPVWYATCKLAPYKDASRARSGSTSDAASQPSSSDDEQSPCQKQSCKKRRLVQTSMKDYTRVQKRRSSSRLRMKQLKNRRLRRGLYTAMLET